MVTHSVTKWSAPSLQSRRSGPGAGGGKVKQPISSACSVAPGPSAVTSVTWPGCGGVSWPTIPLRSISISTLSRSPWNANVRCSPGPSPRTSAPAVSAALVSRLSSSSSSSTVRQVNAAWAARMTLSATGSSRNAAPSSRSSPSSVPPGEHTLATSFALCGGRRRQIRPHGAGLPQPVKASPEGGADAPDGHAQDLADLLIRLRRVGDAQRQERLVPRRQLGQPVAQRLMELRPEDAGVWVSRLAVLQSAVGVRIDGHHPPSLAQLADAFALGGRRQPAGQGVRLAQVRQVLDEPQPYGLADILGVIGRELVGPGHGHDEGRVAAHQLVPGRLTAARARPHQPADLGCVGHVHPPPAGRRAWHVRIRSTVYADRARKRGVDTPPGNSAWPGG